MAINGFLINGHFIMDMVDEIARHLRYIVLIVSFCLMVALISGGILIDPPIFSTSSSL